MTVSKFVTTAQGMNRLDVITVFSGAKHVDCTIANLQMISGAS